MQTHLRSLSLIVALIIGALFHTQLAPLQFLLCYAIGFMLCLTFIGIDTSKLKPQALHIKLIFCLQLSVLISWSIPMLLGYPILAEAFFYVTTAPIATASPVIVSILKGKVEFVTTAMILSQIIFALLMPFILPFVVHGAEVSYWEIVESMFSQMLIVVIIPALLAGIIRKLYPKSMSMRSKFTNVSLGLWVFCLSIVSASSVVKINAMDIGLADIFPFILGSGLICLCNFTIGYRLGKPQHAVEFSQCLGQKNTLLTLMVANHSYSHPLAIIAPTFYIIFHNIANAIQMILAQRRERKINSATGAIKHT